VFRFVSKKTNQINGNEKNELRIKYLEELEDEPFETIEEQLLPDLIYLIDQNNIEVKPNAFGSRFAMLTHLNSLEKEPIEFWRELLHCWLLSKATIEIIMKPSIQLAKKITERKEIETKKRLAELGNQHTHFLFLFASVIFTFCYYVSFISVSFFVVTKM
jgi:Zn-dependent M16 (insulinase) family peptidase